MRRTAHVACALLLVGVAGVPFVTGVGSAATRPAAGDGGVGDLTVTSDPAAGSDQVPATTNQIYVQFSSPVAPLTTDELSIHEVAQDVVGPALPVESLQTTDNDVTWVLQLPSDLASSATYEVQVAGAHTADGLATATTSWRFSTAATGPDPKIPTSLQAALADGGVALAWTLPVDFDRSAVVVVRAEGTLPPDPANPATTVVGTFPDAVQSASDITVAAGHTYTYAAYAVDRRQRMSASFVALPVAIPVPTTPTTPTTPTSTTPTPTTPTPTTPTTGNPQERRSKLLVPASGKRLVARRSIRVRWIANPKAKYYNVQLFKGSKKLLSSFPTRGVAVIPGRLLKPGTYRLVIWSGIGAKRAGRYARAPWISRVIRVGGATAASRRS